MKKGDRVLAFAGRNSSGAIESFGSGVYEGEEVPPEGVIGPFGEMTTPNPKILLDTGEVVWGCECWWGPEDKVKERYLTQGVIVVPITPQEYRAKASNGPAQ